MLLVRGEKRYTPGFSYGVELPLGHNGKRGEKICYDLICPTHLLVSSEAWQHMT